MDQNSLGGKLRASCSSRAGARLHLSRDYDTLTPSKGQLIGPCQLTGEGPLSSAWKFGDRHHSRVCRIMVTTLA